jgi:hypothetical protein
MSDIEREEFEQASRQELEGEPVGTARRCGYDRDITYCDFEADEVPIGTKLYTHPASADVPEKWRTVMKELADDLESEIEARRSGDLDRRIERDLIVVKEARVLLDEQEQGHEWIKCSEQRPNVLDVWIKMTDGSVVACWSQLDGDFYWNGGGSESYILENTVTHWKPRQQGKDHE